MPQHHSCGNRTERGKGRERGQEAWQAGNGEEILVCLNSKAALVHVHLSDIPPEGGRTWANTHPGQQTAISIYSRSRRAHLH